LIREVAHEALATRERMAQLDQELKSLLGRHSDAARIVRDFG
jgi:hypothetical protein